MKSASMRVSGWGLALALAAFGCLDPTPDDGAACPGGRCPDAVTGDVNAPDAADTADAVSPDVAGHCPPAAPNAAEDSCAGDARCEYGTESCCGQTYPSLVCTCADGRWACHSTDACFKPACPDVVADPGAADLPGTDVGPDPCPQDYHAADQTPCAQEGRRCGSDCADSCNWCNFLLCEDGKWIWFEVEPDPDCADDGGQPPADAVPDVAAAPPFRVSDCGGFAAGTKGAVDYCAQGVLEWRREGDVLVVTERRVLLNCCGDRAATVTREGDTWVLAETDAPEGGDGRCRCMCVFDFEVTVPAFPDGVAPFRIVRWITDSGDGPVTTWEGDLIVGDTPGAIMVDPEPVGYGCATE